MNTTAKRRPTVGDKVRLLRDFQPYECGAAFTIIGDVNSSGSYWCKAFDNSYPCIPKNYVELFDELVEPRHDPRVFGNSVVGTEPVPQPVDPLADVKAALKAGKRVRLVRIDGITEIWQTGVFGWSFHLPRNRYEIEPDPIPEPKIEWVLGDKYLTRGGETAVLVRFYPVTRLPNRLVFLGTGKDHWVTDVGDNSPDQIKPHIDDIVKHLKDKS